MRKKSVIYREQAKLQKLNKHKYTKKLKQTTEQLEVSQENAAESYSNEKDDWEEQKTANSEEQGEN